MGHASQLTPIHNMPKPNYNWQAVNVATSALSLMCAYTSPMRNMWAFMYFWLCISIGRCIATKQNAAQMFNTWHSHDAKALRPPAKQDSNMHEKRDKGRKIQVEPASVVEQHTACTCCNMAFQNALGAIHMSEQNGKTTRESFFLSCKMEGHQAQKQNKPGTTRKSFFASD